MGTFIAKKFILSLLLVPLPLYEPPAASFDMTGTWFSDDFHYEVVQRGNEVDMKSVLFWRATGTVYPGKVIVIWKNGNDFAMGSGIYQIKDNNTLEGYWTNGRGDKFMHKLRRLR